MKVNLKKMKKVAAVLLAVVMIVTSITVTPNYAEAATKKTSIKKAKITGIKKSYEYTGKQIKPKVKLQLKKKKLKINKEYTVKYSQNTNVGKAKITIKGKGKYKGTIKKTFRITAKSLSKTVVSISDSNCIYTGKACTPTVTVKDGKKTLRNKKDFTVSYKNNINVGTASIIVKGKGNYKNTVIKEFTISKIENSTTETITTEDITTESKTTESKTTESKTTENKSTESETTEEDKEKPTQKTLQIDTTGLIYNEADDSYSIDDEYNTLKGTLKDADKAEEICVEVHDVYNDVVFTKTIDATAKWEVIDFGLVVGINTVTVSANCGENTVSDTVIIANTSGKNMEKTDITDKDSDSDGLSDYSEKVFGTDPNKADTDEDGINDFDELFVTFTDPFTKDAEKVDCDADGLTDEEEKTIYNTDPNKEDTDGDGINDYLEVQYGLNPLGNDENTIVSINETNDIMKDGVTTATLSGNMDLSLEGEIIFEPVTGCTNGEELGMPIQFYSSTENVENKITFKLDSSAISDKEINNICVAQYDMTTKSYIPVDDSMVDPTTSTVIATVTSNAIYGLIVKKEVDDSVKSEDIKLIKKCAENNHIYAIIEDRCTWDNAKAKCEKLGGHLATITSSVEQKFIEDMLKNANLMTDDFYPAYLDEYRHVWLGGYNNNKEGDNEFKWITGEKMVFENWAENAPNGTNFTDLMQICYAKDGIHPLGVWTCIYKNDDDPNAQSKRAFICEWDNAKDDTTVLYDSRFIEVNSLDYMPGCKSYDDLMYTGAQKIQWYPQISSYCICQKNGAPNHGNNPENIPITCDGYYRDKNGDFIIGEDNLFGCLKYNEHTYSTAAYSSYNSLLLKKSIWLYFLYSIEGQLELFTAHTSSLVFARLLGYYLDGTSTKREYSLREVMGPNLIIHRQSNLEDIANECVNRMESEGRDEIILATAYGGNEFVGSDVLSQTGVMGNKILNFALAAAVNGSRAVMVMKCKKGLSGNYEFSTKYYLYDYYDFEYIKKDDLHMMFPAGLAKAYISIGKETCHGTLKMNKNTGKYKVDIASEI